MVDGEDKSIENMEFILYCFKWLPGLKINYHKSEAFVFGFEESDQWWIANMLNCQLEALPMKYLGIPISDVKLGMVAFGDICDKVAKRFPRGKGNPLLRGGGGCSSSPIHGYEVSHMYHGVLHPST
jgi:hypothetical protein